MAARPPSGSRPGAPVPNQADLFSRPRPAPAAGPRVVSVTELTRALKGLLEPHFFQVAVRGEVSNFRPAGSGHQYFTLKDQGACVSAVLFRNEALRLKFRLQDGQAVVVRGRLSVYEARGQYQIICDSVEPEGAGALALAFAQLKAKLQAEGLFEASRKRPLPFLPRRIGLVTSPSGAALHDFLRVLNDRFPIPVLLSPARVQGEGAGLEIARALRRLAATDVDVVVLTRGGGSIEDLWAFNEEVVARAIAASPVPVVSAVGHEVDFTIADFVADRRCATPTDAAKTLAPARVDLLRALDQHRRHLRQIALRMLAHQRERLGARAGRLGDPRRDLANGRLELDRRAERLARAMRRILAAQHQRLGLLDEKVRAEHPQARLLRAARSLAELGNSVRAAGTGRLSREREALGRLRERLAAASPVPGLARQHKALGALRERAEKAQTRRLSQEQNRLSRAAAGLESLSPLKVLGRGYAIAFDAGGRALRAAGDVAPGARISVLLGDRSEVVAQVEETRPARSGVDPAASGPLA